MNTPVTGPLTRTVYVPADSAGVDGTALPSTMSFMRMAPLGPNSVSLELLMLEFERNLTICPGVGGSEISTPAWFVAVKFIA